MRALVFDGQLRFDEQYEAPRISEDEALIRVSFAGICNTDMEIMAGYNDFHGILGHEFVGVVEQGAPEWIGKRVVGKINIGCGKCRFCLRGVVSQCIDGRVAIGIKNHDGAFADYLNLPVRNLHHVPDNVSDRAAVFVEPLAAALQVLEAVQIMPQDRVVVLGAGKLGMLVAQVLKLTGADVVVPVRHARQRELLQKWGITAVSRDELEDQSVQVVVDCTGNEAGFHDALTLLEPRGTLVLKSTYQGLPTANLTLVAVQEFKIVGSRCGPFDAALRLLANGLVDVESMIDAEFALKDGVEAFARASERGMFKVLLDVR